MGRMEGRGGVGGGGLGPEEAGVELCDILVASYGLLKPFSLV